jgi:TniQ
MRTLPLRLSPVAGESLTGYITRYAHTFALPPGDVVRALGLDSGVGNVKASEHYGVSLSSEQLQRASAATGIATKTLEGMLLERYAGRAFARRKSSSRDALSGEGYAREVHIRRSRYCPQCLRENGAWLLRWQLGWCIACARHQVLLVHRCPNCDTMPWILVRESWPHDLAGELRDPSRCSNRRSGALCRVSFTSPTAQHTASTRLLAAQHYMDALLDGELQPILAGENLAPRAYLRDLRALASVLHHRHDPRPRGARQLLDHPSLLARVLPDALALAGLPSPIALADALRQIGDVTYRAAGMKLPFTHQHRGISPALSEALQRARSQSVWARASRRIGIDPAGYQRHQDLHPDLQLRNVPQLFWGSDYQRELAELFDPSLPDRTGRHFCSVLLARMLAALNWRDAARYLDLPDDALYRDYLAIFADLRRTGQLEELAARIRRLANTRTNGLIDYEQRRRALSD